MSAEKAPSPCNSSNNDSNSSSEISSLLLKVGLTSVTDSAAAEEGLPLPCNSSSNRSNSSSLISSDELDSTGSGTFTSGAAA